MRQSFFAHSFCFQLRNFNPRSLSSWKTERAIIGRSTFDAVGLGAVFRIFRIKWRTNWRTKRGEVLKRCQRLLGCFQFGRSAGSTNRRLCVKQLLYIRVAAYLRVRNLLRLSRIRQRLSTRRSAAGRGRAIGRSATAAKSGDGAATSLRANWYCRLARSRYCVLCRRYMRLC